ncbi:MAG: histidine kinase [Casimicrobiaceae bacterium]
MTSNDPFSRQRFAGVFGRRMAQTLVGSVLVAALEFAATRRSAGAGFSDQIQWLLVLCSHWMLAAIPLGTTFAALEWRAAGAAPTRLAYVVGLLAGVAGAAVLLAWHAQVSRVIAETAVGYDIAWPDTMAYVLWPLLFWSVLGAALHAASLRRAQSTRALLASELARMRSERHLSALRLASLQAQIEPDFIAANLTAIEDMYASDRIAADAALDALIAFLRRAISAMQSATSTVGDECDLAQSYVDALTACGRHAPGGPGSIAADTRGAPMPPATLLPLVQQAICDDAHHVTGARTVIAVARDGERIAISIDVAGSPPRAAALLGTRLGGHESRLRALLGEACSVAMNDDVNGHATFRITIPMPAGAGPLHPAPMA